MKSKRIIVILIMVITILNLIRINVYAESNNIENEDINIIDDNLLNDNNIVMEDTIEDEAIEENTTENEKTNTNTTNNETTMEKDTIEETKINELQEDTYLKSSERTVKDGVYRLAVGADSNKVIEVAGSSTSDNAKVDIWNYGNVPAQKFNIEYEDGYYRIIARHTGKSLTVKDGNLQEGTEIVQSTYEGLDSQKWIIRDSGINGLVISLMSNPTLSITVDGKIANGSKLILSNTQDNNNQMFYFFTETEAERTVKDGVYRLAVGADSSKVIEVAGSSTSDNAKVDIWNYGDVPAQKFNIEYENGYYKITARHTGKSLTVKDGNLKEKSEIVQTTYEGLDSQKWLIRDSGVNGLVISLLSNPTLAITVEGNIVNGSKLILSNTQDNNNQMFYFFNENEAERTVNDGKYELLIGASQQKSIEIAGSATEDNAKVGIWDYGHVSAQQFNIEYANGYYKITAVHTGKSLTVKDGNLYEGTEIVQTTYEGLDSQKWLISDSGINGLTISLMANPNLALTINGNIDNGDNIVLGNLQNSTKQMFYFITVVEGRQTVSNNLYKLLVGADSNKSIEVAGSSNENNAKVDIWDFGNSKAQKFNIEYVDGYYKITAAHSNKSLTVQNNIIQNGMQIVQDDYRDDLSQKWIIRDSGINGLVISPMTRSDLAITIENKIENGSRLILESLQNNNRQMFYFYTTNIGINIDSSKYPGIAEAVDTLTSQHPNWQFEVLYTGIDFYTAVQGEYEHYTVDDSTGKRQYANLVDTNVYKGAWIAPNPVVTGNWAQASYNGIAYFMDPRNFLNDTDAFQFVDLSDYYNSGATLESIQYQVNGTFLNNFAEDVRISCEHKNVNPYYIIARLFQEQSKNGSATIYMDGGDGKQYFNPFNIGAVNGNDVATALAKAKEQGWDSMQKGIEGGIGFIRQNYLDANQNTLYLNKFDVNPNSPGGFYTHQYMQNLSAAYSEARTFRSAYVDTGTLDNTIKFIIPVYENMPTQPAGKPSDPGGVLVTDQGPKSVQVINIDTSLIVRDGPGTQYPEIERLQNGTTMLSVERYDNGWQKVITPSGTIGYCSGAYLQFINDITNCNERVAIQTTTEVNVRIGPGTSFSSLGVFGNGTTGTRILKGAYNANGYTWDLVIFDNGVKGFVATNYLRLI
jgi:beta-N-acetylglucosaminidase